MNQDLNCRIFLLIPHAFLFPSACDEGTTGSSRDEPEQEVNNRLLLRLQPQSFCDSQRRLAAALRPPQMLILKIKVHFCDK